MIDNSLHNIARCWWYGYRLDGDIGIQPAWTNSWNWVDVRIIKSLHSTIACSIDATSITIPTALFVNLANKKL